MRIVYLFHWNRGLRSGVTKKIFSQVKTWREAGEEVLPLCLTRSHDLAGMVRTLGGRAFVYKGGPLSRGRWKAVAQAAEEILKWKPDVVYFRRSLYYPPLERVFKTVPTVIEVQTNELTEYFVQHKGHALYHLLTRRRVDKQAAGFVFVSREIAKMSYYANLEGLKKVIANGVDFQEFPYFSPRNNPTPHLLFMMGYPGSWQGLDKVLQMADLFPEWRFLLIGVSPQKDFPSNVEAFGFLKREAYLPLIKKADIGIGSLALHRKRMNEASPLKVREYLALGLPIIIAYEDTDFPNGAPFILRLPNTEDNIKHSVNQIKSFVEKWRGKRVPRRAVAHLDIRRKEEERLAFLEEVVRQWQRPSRR